MYTKNNYKISFYLNYIFFIKIILLNINENAINKIEIYLIVI